jgi:hypothetical protein
LQIINFLGIFICQLASAHFSIPPNYKQHFSLFLF